MESWAVIHRIKESLDQGLKVSEIARRLGVDRKTVRKYRNLSEKEIRRMRKNARRRSRKIDGFLDWLKVRVGEYEEQGVVNSECIHRELVEMGYEGSARTVRRYVSGMRTRAQKRIYEPFETPPGRQAMVDLGEVRRAPLTAGPATLYFAAMVLCYSRKKYGEWYDRPITTEMFLGFHERALRAMGGVPEEIVYDQTKLAVLKERCGECDFNEDFYGFARFYGFEPYICNKYDPETKGKIEAVVRYAKRGFLPGRTFMDVPDVQFQWEGWLENVADRKPHETTGRPPMELWHEEKEYLSALTDGHYDPQASMERRKVLASGLVKVLGNAYSVPAKYHKAEVLVRVTEEKVEFYDLARIHIWTHWRCSGRGKRFIERSHYEREYSVKTEVLEQEVLEVYESPAMLEVLRRRVPRHYREQLKGLLRLDRDHGREVLREAARRAVAYGCVSLGNMEKIIAGVESGRRSMPLARANQGKALGVGSAEARTLSYYARAVEEREEQEDEGACLRAGDGRAGES
jgi:transposase